MLNPHPTLPEVCCSFPSLMSAIQSSQMLLQLWNKHILYFLIYVAVVQESACCAAV